MEVNDVIMTISKSKYCSICQCGKIAWLKEHMPEEMKPNASLIARMEAGREVGLLARGLFGNCVDVTAFNEDGPDTARMIANTKHEMEKGTEVICEASFSFNGLYCAVDMLRKDGDGWAIYEVKSSTVHEGSKDDREVYIADAAFQKYVLEHCGVKVTGTYLVCINGDYVFNGTLDLHQLFSISDVTEAASAEAENIEAKLFNVEKILASPDEPDIDLSENCNSPYPCVFWNHCARDLPKPSVFDLYRMRFSKKIEMYKDGLTGFGDLISSQRITNEKQLRQMDFALHDRGTYVDRENIREFLGELSYPLYFLDFETMQPVIPQYVGTRPYAQIPFQYSLHYIECEGGALKHKEFLAESGTDPRRALAERLCADIPMNVCVTAYNKAFECTRIKELAETFPDLAEHLLNIESNIRDLLVPFQSGFYYNRAMGGSFSIKSVLPAIFPDDPELDYHNLEGVHNGGEAMTIFPQIQHMEPEEQKTARRNLLKYCELDTYAMVKVWEELVRAAA